MTDIETSYETGGQDRNYYICTAAPVDIPSPSSRTLTHKHKHISQNHFIIVVKSVKNSTDRKFMQKKSMKARIKSCLNIA